jgi:apolipoprotein N-acyltransferase
LRGGSTPSLQVAALAADYHGEDVVPQAGTPEGQALLRRYADEVGGVAGRGAQLVLIPENVVSVHDADAEAFEALFREAARANAVDVVVGAGRFTAGGNRNLAYVFPADGGEPRQYAKRHLVPGLERMFTPGDGRRLIDAAPVRWGVAICKDFDFPALSRGYGSERVGLMLAPAWDFVDDAWLHGRMAVLRGVENGFALLRSARDGLLTLSDDRGRVLASATSASAPMASIVAMAPTVHRPTLYTRVGDAFSVACGAAFVLLSAWLAIESLNRRRSK